MNFFDITKSIALVAVIGFLWFHGNALVSGFNKPSIPPAIIRTIDTNAVKLSLLTASNKEVESLRKDFESKNSKILADYENQKKQTKEVLEELGEVKAEQKQTRDLINRQSDKITTPENEKLAYEFKKVYAKDADGTRFPIAWVMYHPNQSDDKRWKTGTYPLEYYTKVIETENRDGTFNRYAEVHLENNQMEETKGKKYPIKLKNIEWAKVETKEKSWMLWNPRLGFGVAVTPGYIAPTLDISIASYGRTGTDLDWRFLVFGASINKDSDDDLILIGSFEPCSWNIGNVLPLIENMFVGPIWSIDTNSETKIGVKTVIPF